MATSTLNVVAQVVGGIIVVALVYKMCLWILHRDQLVSDINDQQDTQQNTLLLDGWAASSSISDYSWSTVDPYAINYAPISRSLNRKGGAQFTYTFWMQLNDVSPDNVANKALLLRGDSTVYTWVRSRPAPPDAKGADPVNVPFTDVLVKCPLIRFGDTYDHIVVEFNTLNDPSASLDITSSPDEPARHNLLKLMPTKWVMLTFTFEDNVPIDDFEDGIVVRFFLNDVLYQTGRMPAALRLNMGDLYVMPTVGAATKPIASANIGNLRYHNYALQLGDVRALFARGPPTKPASLSDSSMPEPLYLSEYNKMDVYNA